MGKSAQSSRFGKFLTKRLLAAAVLNETVYLPTQVLRRGPWEAEEGIGVIELLHVSACAFLGHVFWCSSAHTPHTGTGASLPNEVVGAVDSLSSVQSPARICHICRVVPQCEPPDVSDSYP